MDKEELEIKQDENRINYIGEKIEKVSNTNMMIEEERLQKFIAKDILIKKLITVAGQMFIEYEKELDNSNQII